MRHRVKATSVFILEIGIAASIAMVGAMVVLLTLVTPADRSGSPLILNAVERLETLSRPETFIRTNVRAGVISDSDLSQPFGTPWPPRFIVGVTPDADIAPFLRTFRENRRRARASFANWAETDPRFQGFYLEGMTTSGEAILSYQQAGDTGPSLELERQLIERLSSSPDVRHITRYRGMRAAS